MGTSAKILIGVLGLFVILAISLAGIAINTNDTCVRHEAAIEAQWMQNQNNYANYFNKIKEMAQIPEMYTGDLRKVYDGVMQGRYGNDGSKAMVQLIQEHNPNFDSSMYTRIQQAIESGRNSFEADQKTLIDRKRVYEVYLGSAVSGMMARAMGFPRKDLSRFNLVTNEETQRAFETGQAGPIRLR